MLAALLNDARIYAHSAQKGGRYLCPGCKAELVLRKGDIVIHHFAHKPPVECEFGAGESAEHLEAKLAIFKAFAPRALKAEMEWPVESLTGDRRADVFIWDMQGAKIAFEIQHTEISGELIAKRSADYMRAGISVIWIPVLKSKFRAQAARVKDGEPGDWLVPNYRPRPFESWLHAFNYGQIWYWAPRAKQLMRGKMEQLMEKVENTFIGGPQEHSIGWALRLWGPHEPSSLALRVGARAEKQAGRHWLPAGPVAKLETVGGKVSQDGLDIS